MKAGFAGVGSIEVRGDRTNAELSGGQYFGINTYIISSVCSCIGLGGRVQGHCPPQRLSYAFSVINLNPFSALKILSMFSFTFSSLVPFS